MKHNTKIQELALEIKKLILDGTFTEEEIKELVNEELTEFQKNMKAPNFNPKLMPIINAAEETKVSESVDEPDSGEELEGDLLEELMNEEDELQEEKKDIKIEVEEFVKKTEILLKDNNVEEGDYVILITIDQITVYVYKNLKQFQEKVIEDTKKLGGRVNWQVYAFD